MADLPPEVRDDIGLLEGHCESFQWLTPVVQNVRNYCERVTAERDEYKVRAERAEIAQVDAARESICEVATHNKSVHDYMIHWESRTKNAEEEADELRASLKLRTSADARAIAAWRVAHPGNDLIQPDHADLCVWLADRAEKAEADLLRLSDAFKSSEQFGRNQHERAEEAEAELLRLARENAELRAANESVRVCRDHTAELVSDGECLVCALQKAEAERDELRKRINEAPRVEVLCGTRLANPAVHGATSVTPGTRAALVVLGDDDG